MNNKKFIKQLIKPKITSGLLLTFVCLGPFGNLVFNIITKDYSRLIVYALLSFPTLIIIGAYWFWHINKTLNIQNDVEEINNLLD